ncbi:MAG TPA: hypothetical protein PK306_25180 [Aquabacterium sp.]|nr:hypothetical protein [Aquabacterium sp.]HQC99003.1 hypothetical protein [Aquabacterium sp.]
MQGHYPAEFRREQGFTEADWLNCLPGATAGHALVIDGPGRATVAIGPGHLHLAWQARPPRQIALMRMPVLATHYRFDGVPDDQRQAFMKFFDLYTQRGGG